MARLGIALYQYTCHTKPETAFCLIDCIPPLKGFFLRLGYRQIGPAVRHPSAGPVLPMAFAVYDLAHFRRVRSPLADVCPRLEQWEVDWFESTFAMSCGPSLARPSKPEERMLIALADKQQPSSGRQPACADVPRH